MKLIRRNSSGEVMVEAAIIMVFIITLLLFLVALGFYFYQMVMLKNAANSTAAHIAENYKYITASLDDESITPDAADSVRLYRVSFLKGKMESEYETLAQSYAEECIKSRSLGLSENVTVENVALYADNIGRLHVEVQLKMDTEVIFQGVMEMLGVIDDNSFLAAHGTAECLDVSAYMNYVRFVDYLGDKYGSHLNGAASIVSSVQNIISMLTG